MGRDILVIICPHCCYFFGAFRKDFRLVKITKHSLYIDNAMNTRFHNARVK